MAEKQFSIADFRRKDETAIAWVKKELRGELKYRALHLTNSEVLADRAVDEAYEVMKDMEIFFLSLDDIRKFLFEELEVIAARLLEPPNEEVEKRP